MAEIHGQVLDPSGSAIPGATVRAIQTDTEYTRTTTSDATGGYILPNLPLGPYRLEVTGQGFKTYVQSGILLQVGNNVQINASLQVGTMSENIEVKAQASMVETQRHSVSQVVDQQRIFDLPLNGRQATQLILLSGAATTTPSGNDDQQQEFPQLDHDRDRRFGQGNGTNYLLDGGDNNDTCSQCQPAVPLPRRTAGIQRGDQRASGTQWAASGRRGQCGDQVGHQRLHGDLFEFLRNGDVNARNYLRWPPTTRCNATSSAAPSAGPIVKDKLFFFGGYQGTRQCNRTQSQIMLPDGGGVDRRLQHLVSALRIEWKRNLINPLTERLSRITKFPYPCSTRRPSRWPVSAAVRSHPTAESHLQHPRTGDEDQWIGRVDCVQSPSTRFSGATS